MCSVAAVHEDGVAQVAFLRTRVPVRRRTHRSASHAAETEERPDQEATAPAATSTELTVDAWATYATAAIYQFFICNQSSTGVLAISGAPHRLLRPHGAQIARPQVLPPCRQTPFKSQWRRNALRDKIQQIQQLATGRIWECSDNTAE